MIRSEEWTPQITYRLHQNGLHELIYNESSHEAVDAFFSYISRFAEDGHPDDVYCILNDLRFSNHQPLNYYFSSLRAINQKYDVQNRPKARIALVYGNNSPFVGTVDALIRVINPARVKIRLFSSVDYPIAVEWLHQELKNSKLNPASSSV